MALRESIRAVQRIIDLAEALIADWAELGDELAAIVDKVADETYLGAARDRVASAKRSAEAALPPLRQWLKSAKADDDAEPGD
jgi:hypothetical protein